MLSKEEGKEFVDNSSKDVKEKYGFDDYLAIFGEYEKQLEDDETTATSLRNYVSSSYIEELDQRV